MPRRSMLSMAVLIAVCHVAVFAQAPAPGPAAPVPDITGTWTASFETQIGTQTYTYEFIAKDTLLTGTASSSLGSKSEIREGRIDGAAVTFKETLTYMEMAIEVSYSGDIVSADEIRFSRSVGEFATEELVATRVK